MRKVVTVTAIFLASCVFVAVMRDPIWVLYSLRAEAYLWGFKPKYTGAECLIRIEIKDGGGDVRGAFDKLLSSFFRYQVIHEPGSIGFGSQIDSKSFYTMLRDDCHRRWEIAQGMIDYYVSNVGNYPNLSVTRDDNIPIPQQMRRFSARYWVDGKNE
jgi:hypothetical protein